MDKAKNLAKGGWHPPGDRSVSRKTWKSDLKGIATGKKDDKSHYENAMGHQSAPLTSLRDPDAFGPPPKHKEFYDEQGNSLNPVAPASVSRYQAPQRVPQRPGASGGWGSVVPTPNRKQQEEEQQQQEEEAKAARGPYKADTTGLRTDNLPAPPLRRDAPAPPPATPPRNSGTPASPVVPQRQPQPQARAAPPPTLPPRMTEHPDEHTPPPPPSYNEAIAPVQQDPATLNTAAVSRLGQAGVAVPGFGIGDNSTGAQQASMSPSGHTGQLSELQQRFARMRSGSEAETTPASPTSSSAAAAAAHKKPPPPPPPKKPNLHGAIPTPPGSSDGTAAPPPLPMASKPRQG